MVSGLICKSQKVAFPLSKSATQYDNDDGGGGGVKTFMANFVSRHTKEKVAWPQSSLEEELDSLSVCPNRYNLFVPAEESSYCSGWVPSLNPLRARGFGVCSLYVVLIGCSGLLPQSKDIHLVSFLIWMVCSCERESEWLFLCLMAFSHWTKTPCTISLSPTAWQSSDRAGNWGTNSWICRISLVFIH